MNIRADGAEVTHRRDRKNLEVVSSWACHRYYKFNRFLVYRHVGVLKDKAYGFLVASKCIHVSDFN